VYGDVKATTAVISFGSNKGVLLDAIESVSTKDKATKLVQLRCLMPFPVSEMTAALKGVKKILVVEGNDTGLLEGLLREQLGVVTDKHLRFYDGRPLTQPAVERFIHV
jgi:2-oxoglutarate ferredoxin oxidoreductase subunit alpha